MTTFYVDNTGGADANNGQSEGAAWKTIAKVNAEVFTPGDYVLFKRGETWVGTRLVFPSSGAAGSPITIDAYGSGALPIIDGNDAVDCVDISAKSYITINNIEITQGLDFGFIVHAAANNIILRDCVAHDCGNDNIVIIDNAFDCQVINCTSYDAYERLVGPRTSCLEIADGSHDIAVRGCDLYGSESTGIAIHSHAATEFPYNITIDDVSSNENDDFGILITQDNAAAALPADVSILISNCTFNENAGPGAGGGIYLQNTGDPQPVGIVFDQCEAISAFERPANIGIGATFTRCVFYGQWQARVEGAEGVVFYNCTFYRMSSIALDIRGATDGVTMLNCIVISTGNIPIAVETITNVSINWMLYDGALDIEANAVMHWDGVNYTWANWLINSGQDANSPIPASPQFLSVGVNDFRLQPTSPAIDRGIQVGFPFTGAAPDLGAHEYASPKTFLSYGPNKASLNLLNNLPDPDGFWGDYFDNVESFVEGLSKISKTDA